MFGRFVQKNENTTWIQLYSGEGAPPPKLLILNFFIWN
jgi:hypothetical protein